MLVDPDRLLALLLDPAADTREVAAATGATPEESDRAARLVRGIAEATSGEVSSLQAVLAAAVARAALAAGRADLLAALAGRPERQVAKEAKRGLHLLRSRGVAVPEPSKRPAPPTPPMPVEEGFPCFVSAMDGQGERAVWISRPVPGRGVEVGQAVVSDVLGVLDLQVRRLSRKEFRTFARDVSEKGRALAVAEIDREQAKTLVAAARTLNDAAGRRVPEGSDGWLARLGPAAPPRDPAERFPPLAEDQERAALEASGELHRLPALRGWLADEDHLRALAGRLDEIAVSPLYLDERQRAEQAGRAVADALEAWLDLPRRRRLSARLFATAAHLESLGEEEQARRAAAVARAVSAGVPAARIPFVRMLVEKAFPGSPPAPAEPSLIVAPR